MKKFLGVLAIAGSLVACTNSGTSDATKDSLMKDSLMKDSMMKATPTTPKMSSDSGMNKMGGDSSTMNKMSGDTSKMNKMSGDTSKMK